MKPIFSTNQNHASSRAHDGWTNDIIGAEAQELPGDKAEKRGIGKLGNVEAQPGKHRACRGGGGFGTRPRYLIVCLWRRLLTSRHCSF